MSALPHFLIIGAMKSGTTSLYEDLARHPDFFLPDDKEPDILHHAKGNVEKARALYTNHFKGAAAGQLCGEASTMYTMIPWFDDVSGFAKQAIGPELKLIYIVRDPIDRITSHLMHDFMAGRIQDTDFDSIVRSHERFVSISDYARQISPWINAFGPGAILVLTLEELSTHRAAVVERVVGFLGARPGRVQVGTAASNPRAAIRATANPLVSSLISSPIYRRRMRRLLPQSLVRFFRMRLTKSRTIPSAALSEAIQLELKSELTPSMRLFQELTGIQPAKYCVER